MSKSEVAVIEQLHRAAQARLGIAGSLVALEQWAGVSGTNAVATSSGWLTRQMRVILAIRRKSRKLAADYLRLVKALESERTYQALIEEASGPTLSILQRNFEKSILDIASLDKERSDTQDANEQLFEQLVIDVWKHASKELKATIPFDQTDIRKLLQQFLDIQSNSDKPLTVDNIDWLQEGPDGAIVKSFRNYLKETVLDPHDAKVKAFKSMDLEQDSLDAKLDQQMKNSGSLGAGVIDWAGLSAGRDLIEHQTAKDKLVKMVARGVRPGCCAFCAMLASRGFVYRSETSAGFGGNKYHINCHCYPIVHWTTDAELPPANTWFAQKWEDVIHKGYTDYESQVGNRMLNTWRTWLSKERAAGHAKF